MSDVAKNHLVILSPCFNENVTAIQFLKELETELKDCPEKFTIVVIDDSSIDNTLGLLQAHEFSCSNVHFRVLSLKYNTGHQGAIYQGILYAQSLDASHVIVMDSDGEDDPRAILELVKYKDEPIDILHVARGQRKESFTFRLFYRFYKMLFFLITNRSMNFGNYSMINRRIIDATVATSFVHFAAHLSKQKAVVKKIVFNRRSRLDGKSKMSLNSLIYHAFKSFVEYAEDLLMVFLKLFIFIVVCLFVLAGFVVYQKLFTNNAILGWASTLTAILCSTAILCLGFFVIGILLLNIMSKSDNSRRESIYRIVK